jgi:hypothetical protein
LCRLSPVSRARCGILHAAPQNRDRTEHRRLVRPRLCSAPRPVYARIPCGFSDYSFLNKPPITRTLYRYTSCWQPSPPSPSRPLRGIRASRLDSTYPGSPVPITCISSTYKQNWQSTHRSYACAQTLFSARIPSISFSRGACFMHDLHV